MDRPSFCIVLRELSEFMNKSKDFLLPSFIFVFLYHSDLFVVVVFLFLGADLDISPSETLPNTGQGIFHKRFLKSLYVLGEVSPVR